MPYSLCSVSRKVQVTNMNDCENGSMACSVIAGLQMQIAVDNWGEGVKTPGECCLPLADHGKVQSWDVQPGSNVHWEHKRHQMKMFYKEVWSCFAVQPVRKHMILNTFHRLKLPLTSICLDDHYHSCAHSVLHLALRLPACRCKRGKMVQKTAKAGRLCTEGLKNS